MVACCKRTGSELWVLVAAFAITPLLVAPPPARASGSGKGAVLGRGEGPFAFDGDLRSLPTADLSAQRKFALPPHAPLLPGRAPGGPSDALLRVLSLPTLNIPSPIVGFDGMAGGNPPDTNGVVGPNHYIQTINVSYAIWDKTGTQLVAPTSFTSLFAASPATGTPCDGGFTSDPVVLYDPMADRFILTILAFPGIAPPPPGTLIPPFYECIAVSQTNDPVSGGWYKYALLAHLTDLNDFPKLGVWPDAYYMSANMNGCCGGGTYVRVWALDRISILGGGALNEQHFDVQSGYNSLLPSNMHGTPPPAGEPNVFATIDYNNNSVLDLWNFHVDWAVPANSTFGVGAGHTPDNVVAVAAYTHLTASIPQPGTTTQFLDPLGDRADAQAQYRRVGGTESLWVNHPVDTGGNVSGIRWYEVRDPSGAPTLFQQGTWNNGGDGINRWMGSMAADRFGNMAIGYNVSNSSVSPGIRYAGRLVTDAAGTMGQGEATLVAGAGNLLNCTPNSQCTGSGVPDACCTGSGTGTCSCTGRWGDYSGMSVDPVDDCTFWFTGEYATGGTNRTRIGSFELPGCEADLSVTKTAAATVVAGTDLTYSLTIANGGPVAAQLVSLTDATPPGTTFVSLTQNTGPTFACTTPSVGGTGSVDCTIAAFANGATATFTLVVHVLPSTPGGSMMNTATASSSTADPTSGNNADSATTTVNTEADVEMLSKSDSPDPVTAGTDLTYTISARNNGPSDAQNFTITDPLPAGTTFVSVTPSSGGICVTPLVGDPGTVSCTWAGGTAPGTTRSATVVAHVLPSVPDGAVLSNTATASSSTTDPTPGNESQTATTDVIARADLSITKTDTPDPVLAGNTITYTLTSTNNGPSDAQGVVITDTIPTNTRFVSSSPSAGGLCTDPPVGGSGTVTCTYAGATAPAIGRSVTIVVRVCAEVACGAVVSDTATTSSSTTDPDPSNNTSPPATTTVQTQSDLSLVKTGTPDTAYPGQHFSYFIHVTNNGPSSSVGTTVVETMPAGFVVMSVTPTQGSCSGAGTGAVTCNLGTLGAANQCAADPTTASILIVTAVPPNQSAGPVMNTATVSSGNCLADNNGGDNTAQATTIIVPVPAPLLDRMGLLAQVLILLSIGAWSLYRVGRAR